VDAPGRRRVVWNTCATLTRAVPGVGASYGSERRHGEALYGWRIAGARDRFALGQVAGDHVSARLCAEIADPATWRILKSDIPITSGDRASFALDDFADARWRRVSVNALRGQAVYGAP